MDPGAAVACALAALGSWLLGCRMTALLGHGPLATPNWRGELVPAGAGVVLLPPALLAAWVLLPRAEALALIAGTGLCGLGGLLDDAAGRGEPKGWHGHGAALRRGRLTAGGYKAITGIGAALLVAGTNAPQVLLLALGANAINSLDTRPGVAILAYLAGCAPLLWLAPAALLRALPLGAAALGFLPLDLGERAMLGDAGAMMLGFGAAYAWAGASATATLAAAGIALGVICVGDRVSLGERLRPLPRRSPAGPGE